MAGLQQERADRGYGDEADEEADGANGAVVGLQCEVGGAKCRQGMDGDRQAAGGERFPAGRRRPSPPPSLGHLVPLPIEDGDRYQSPIPSLMRNAARSLIDGRAALLADQLDAVAVGVANEGDAVALGAATGAIGGLFGLDAVGGEILEGGV